jgi:hypothetical protein
MSTINEMLVKGIAPPTFEEITGAAVVTFRGNVFEPRRETAESRGTARVTARVVESTGAGVA